MGYLQFDQNHFEALDEIYFYRPTTEPKYIYYIGKSKSYDEWNANVKKYKERNLYEDYEKKMFERKLTYEDEEDDYSGDDSSESKGKEKEISITEIDNNVVKKGKEKESITKLDNKVAKEEEISINDLNNKINELNRRNDEINSKIDKLLNVILSKENTEIGNLKI
ncbi:8341_t:CDS:1 [Funneliformis mosseae]|uniref:8341_t:CDS:1 n=1 Tax=Funneliformis mosseae TaxID=27381 RepID=A0A9N9IRI3_FUNMO|nr:8341_t:CDS:1 [Funneliformis mosseae]